MLLLTLGLNSFSITPPSPHAPSSAEIHRLSQNQKPSLLLIDSSIQIKNVWILRTVKNIALLVAPIIVSFKPLDKAQLRFNPCFGLLTLQPPLQLVFNDLAPRAPPLFF